MLIHQNTGQDTYVRTYVRMYLIDQPSLLKVFYYFYRYTKNPEGPKWAIYLQVSIKIHSQASRYILYATSMANIMTCCVVEYHYFQKSVYKSTVFDEMIY